MNSFSDNNDNSKIKKTFLVEIEFEGHHKNIDNDIEMWLKMRRLCATSINGTGVEYLSMSEKPTASDL